MPFGLPFIARPGQEGFDQYGRMIPPELPEGWDGWGRPLVGANAQPGGAQPPNIPPAGGVQPQPQGAGEAQPGFAPTNTRDAPFTVTQSTSSSTGTGRPDQPSCFDRPPAPADSYFRYADFEPFSLPASSLNHIWELHLSREFVGHDVSEEDWEKFVNDLAREALQNAPHNWARGGRNEGTLGRGPAPVLSDAVHSLLASWAVAFFAPRGIRVYAAQDGKRVIPLPIDPSSTKRGYSRPDEWSDEDGLSDEEDESDWAEEESRARRDDAYLPRREREVRRDERMRARRRDRRRRRDMEVESRRSSRRKDSGTWEVHFIAATPTIWVAGARPRTYGEPVVRLRR
ncbi:hypothetical protein BD324DRAFT_583336 [Kockovaella imperatae]|uniref:Uncharacterized protein n=1 Tax=Kockovaella imperatae TaxID=4999 RepID=A0A1Y1UBE1_9TREE|nr:hypothetical protein BD324DRAFT_583336 [Kockovaella imperatae]ORX34395.1 hypothetical protein BD324DRAFT_583336 [Kockovaella imperatae]